MPSDADSRAHGTDGDAAEERARAVVRDVAVSARTASFLLIPVFLLAGQSRAAVTALTRVVDAVGVLPPLVVVLLGSVAVVRLTAAADVSAREPADHVQTIDPDDELPEVRASATAAIANQIRAVESQSTDAVRLLKVDLFLGVVSVPTVSFLLREGLLPGVASLDDFYVRAAVVAWLFAVATTVLAYRYVSYRDGLRSETIDLLQANVHEFLTSQNYLIADYKRTLERNARTTRRLERLTAAATFLTASAFVLFLVGLFRLVYL